MKKNGYWFRLHSACRITNAKQFKSLSNESIGKMYLQRVTHTMWGKKPKDNIPDGTCERWKRVFPQLSFRNGYLLLMLPNEEKRLSNKWKRIKAIRKNHTSRKEKYEKVWPNKIFASMILWRKWNVQTWISTVSSDVYVWSVDQASSANDHLPYVWTNSFSCQYHWTTCEQEIHEVNNRAKIVSNPVLAQFQAIWIRTFGSHDIHF